MNLTLDIGIDGRNPTSELLRALTSGGEESALGTRGDDVEPCRSEDQDAQAEPAAGECHRVFSVDA
jgi:hypothetical protein